MLHQWYKIYFLKCNSKFVEFVEYYEFDIFVEYYKPGKEKNSLARKEQKFIIR